MSPELFVSLTAGVIALVFGYFPALRVMFAALSSEAKSGIMIGLMVLVGFAAWGAGCIGWIATDLACTQDSIPTLIKLILIAIVSNQATNRIAPELEDVKGAKLARYLPDQSGEVANPETVTK